MHNDIVIKEVPPIEGLTFTRIVPRDGFDEMAYFGSLFMKAFRGAGLALQGPIHVHYAAADDEGTLRVTMIHPVADAPELLPLDAEDYLVEPGDALRLATADGVLQAATCTFEGTASRLPEQLARIASWAAENGYRCERDFRMVMLRGPMHTMPDGGRVHPEQMIWEVQQEIRAI